MLSCPDQRRRRPAGWRRLACAVVAAVGLSGSAGVGWALHEDDRPIEAQQVRRSRTDIPREVPVLPAVTAPDPRRSPAPVSPADLDAARDVVWPLPAACTEPETTDPRGRLPRQGGYSTDPASIGADARLRRVLGLREGRLVGLDGAGAPSRCDQLRWRVVAAAIPAEQLPHLDQLVLYDYPEHVLTDPGRSGGVRTGFFEPNPTDPTRYRIALATDLSDDEQLLTLAHEVGHVVSLYPDRPRPRRTADCAWVIDDAGTCASDESPLSAFYASTYAPTTRDRVSALYANRRQPTREELGAVYRERPTEFVSSYAATHPTEDFAESYAYWCLYGISPAAPVEGAATNGLAKRAFFDRLVDEGRLGTAQCSALRGVTARR